MTQSEPGLPVRPAPARPTTLVNLALALVGGLVHAAAFPPLGWWPLVFLGPVVLLRALRGASPREGAAVGLAWGMAALALPGRWAVTVALARHEGLPEALLALVVLAASPALFGLLHGLATRWRTQPQLLAAFSWVAIEWLRGWVPITPCSWFTFAHALGDGAARPLCMMGSVAGTTGLSFLVMSSAALMEDGIANLRVRPGRFVAHLTVGLGVPVIVWQLGFLVLMSASPTEAAPWTAFQTVIVQDGGAPEAKVLFTGAGLEKARRDLTPAVHALLWPGLAWPRDPYASGSLEPELRMCASAFRSAFVLGASRSVEGQAAPTVVAIAPTGRKLGERLATEEPWILDAGPEQLGVLCGVESASEDACRALVVRGATILLVAASDPPEWPREARLQHALHASLRAAALRRPLLRAAPFGPSFGLDYLGRPYRHIPEGAPGVVVARVGGDTVLTFHARAGRFAPHLALFLTGCWLMAIASRATAQPRPRSSDAASDASL